MPIHRVMRTPTSIAPESNTIRMRQAALELPQKPLIKKRTHLGQLGVQLILQLPAAGDVLVEGRLEGRQLGLPVGAWIMRRHDGAVGSLAYFVDESLAARRG